MKKIYEKPEVESVKLIANEEIAKGDTVEGEVGISSGTIF